MVVPYADSAPAPSTGNLRKGQLTRKLLLEAATRVFAEHGYINAEISQITREAGKSTGVFYTYFTNKSDLLVSLVREFESAMREEMPYSANPPEDAARVVSVIWTIYKAHAPTLLALQDAATVDATFAESQTRLRDYAREDFLGMVRTRQSQGLCQGLDAHFTAVALETMLSQCLNQWLGRGSDALKDPAKERLAFDTLARIIDIVLNGAVGAESDASGR